MVYKHPPSIKIMTDGKEGSFFGNLLKKLDKKLEKESKKGCCCCEEKEK